MDGNMFHVMFYRKSHVYQKYIFIFLLLIALGATKHGYSQALSKVDSLKNELRVRVDDNRFNVLWGIAYELFDVDNLQAISYARQANALALRDGDSLGIVKSGRILGQLLRRVDELDESIDVLSGVLPISQRNNYLKETKLILNGLAIAFAYRADYDKALEYHFQSLVIREKEENKKEISIALNNIGLVYFKLSNFDLAINYYQKALKAKEEVNDAYDMDRLLINLGLCYNSLKDDVKAQEYFNRAFSVCGSLCNNQIIMEGEYGLGSSFLRQKNYQESERHFRKSLELSLKEKNRRFELENLVSLMQICLDQDDLKSATVYHSQVVSVSKEIPYNELLLRVYQLEADFFIKKRDFESANYFQRKYSALRDSIFTGDVIKNLTRVQTQYAQRENLSIIAAKDQVLELKEEVITQQSLLNWLLIAVISLASVLGVVIYRNYRQAKAVNKVLASAKKIIEEQNLLLDREVQDKTRELVDTNKSLVKVNDELDNFIYKTSHDIRGPLASLKGMVNLAIMDVKDEKALGYLSKLDLTAEKLNSILTRLLIVNRINHAELKPEVIHFEPIIQEILTLEMKKGLPSKIRIDYDVAPKIELVSDREMVRLVLENLIDNAVKFYNESQRVESFIKIVVRPEEGKVSVHVIDNGVGIAQMSRENIFQMFVRASERSDTGGIGLYLAKLAAEKLGGDINLATSGIYTEFIVVFPENLHSIIRKRKETMNHQAGEDVLKNMQQGAGQSA